MEIENYHRGSSFTLGCFNRRMEIIRNYLIFVDRFIEQINPTRNEFFLYQSLGNFIFLNYQSRNSFDN